MQGIQKLTTQVQFASYVKKSEETTTHFLIVCEKLEETRIPILNKIIQEVSSIFAEQKLG
jgi:hypothetical protein